MEAATVSQVLRRYAPQYLERFGDTMPAEQKKVLRVVTACRTGSLGTVRYDCVQCGESHFMGRSCGNRHCVLCQADRSREWLAKQEAKRLPCHYFLITFTVPPEVQRVMRSNPKDGYDALFRASAGALKLLATNGRHPASRSRSERQLVRKRRSRPGFCGVLHTWTRDLNYHPHVHYVVPGGGLNADATEWLPSRPNYFVPDAALAKVFRAKLRDEFRSLGLFDDVEASAWTRDWIVDCKAVGDGKSTLKYLAAYVFRVGVTEHRITACSWHDDMDEAIVTLQVKRSGTSKYRPMRLTATEFLRRYLQHVLPTGFQKVRHYGFLSSANRVPMLLIRWLVAAANDRTIELCRTEVIVTPRVPRLRCSSCGGVLIRREITLACGLRIAARPPPALLATPGRPRGSP